MRRNAIILSLLALTLLAASSYAEVRKEVDIWVARDVAPGPKIRLVINTRNVPVVEMSAYRLGDPKILINRDDADIKLVRDLKPAEQWRTSLIGPNEYKETAQSDKYRSRQVNLPVLKPGVYLLVARGGQLEATALVNITNLTVVVKRSTKHVLAWVCDADSGKPVVRAKIAIYKKTPHVRKDKAGKETVYYTDDLAVTGVTKDDGTCMIDMAPADEATMIVSRGEDFAAVSCGVTSHDGELKSHFQTDRPIYRPGQTVYYKAILRRTKGRVYTAVANTPCAVEIRDPKDHVIDDAKIPSTSFGSVSGQFDIPTEGALGPYSIVVKAGEDSVYTTFTVAEYRKPNFKVDIKPVAKRYIAGEDASFNVDAQYYFGTPLQQAKVHYVVRRNNNRYWWSSGRPEWYASSDGNLYSSDTYGSNDFVAEGTVATDDSGKAVITIKTKPDAPDSNYSIECTVEDDSQRQVEGSGSVPVYAAEIRVGIQTDVVSVPLGSNIPVKLRVVDVDGNPAAAIVKLALVGLEWDEKSKNYKRKTFADTEVNVPASGTATAQIPARTEGDVDIVASAVDKLGHRTSNSISVWVAKPGSKVATAGESKEPKLTVKLDRTSYSPGDEVKSWIMTNTTNRPILVTAEGYDIWQYKVLPAGQSTYSFDFKATVDMSPNTFIEAVQWTSSGMITDSEMVPVPDETRKINVAIESKQSQYRPGDTMNYTIRTTGPNGKPVPAEVAVAVIDEAIYAVRPDTTPDLYQTFWATRSNTVITNYSAPEEVSGGAYQRVDSTAPVRQKFVDTAFWNANVQTGPDGNAEISFETPGNLTTWKMTARAITADTKVGSGSYSTTVSRPVMLQLATPRQIVQGDHLKLVSTVINRTDKDRKFETSISAIGINIDDVTTKTVDIPAGGKAVVEWNISADSLPESGVASITSRTIAADARPDEGDELSDALKLSVPVVPKGIMHRIVEGGTLALDKTITLTLPQDRIKPAGLVRVSVYAGLGEMVDKFVDEAANGWRCGGLGAANHLLALSMLDSVEKDDVKSTIAELYSEQRSNGAWGGWYGDSSDSEITAAVLTALVRANSKQTPVPRQMIEWSVNGAAYLYGYENLWERSALLASSIVLAGHPEKVKLQDIHDKADHLSPFTLATLAEAYLKAGHRDWAVAAVDEVLKNAVIAPETAYIPVGDRPGWSTSTREATAQALLVLNELSMNDSLQAKLVSWLVDPESTDYMSGSERVLTAYALNKYVKTHPQPTNLGDVEIIVNGTSLGTTAPKRGIVKVDLPGDKLVDGDNSIELKRSDSGEVFYSIEARVFEPVDQESWNEIRVLRRYETVDSAGMWRELKGSIKPSQPIRCTVMVWPNDRPDDIRVVEPLPSGFEYISGNYYDTYAAEEIRDGAVIHLLRSEGTPVYFTYYLRAESEGSVTSLPASAEALRRPQLRGNSEQVTLDVRK